MLSLLGALLVCSAAWAAEETVTVESTGPVDVDVTDSGDIVVNTDEDADVIVTTESAPRGSLRDEYRQWSRSNPRTTSRRTARTSSGNRIDIEPDSVDDFDSINDLEDAGRDIEDWANEDVANTDRDDWDDLRRETRVTTRRTVNRYADYPEYDDDDVVVGDRIGDRMYDDYDRSGGDRYWSRSYGDVRYWDNRSSGCPCNKCTKCVRGGSCGKCGTSKCGGKCGVKSKCGCHKPAVKCGSNCGSKCTDKCAPRVIHKPAKVMKCGCVSKCGGKCGSKGCGSCGKVKSKCACGFKAASRKCSKC